MARRFGKVFVSIWNDPAWLGLPANAQRVYMLLLSQGRVTLAGSLDLMPGRWARYAADSTVDEVWAGLLDLERVGFVVIDRATDEVLIRTLTVHDLDASRLSGQVIKGLWSAWQAIASPVLRKVAVDNMPDDVWEKSGKTAPAEALRMRTSAPLEWASLLPPERETPAPHEREQHPADSTAPDDDLSTGGPEPRNPTSPPLERKPAHPHETTSTSTVDSPLSPVAPVEPKGGENSQAAAPNAPPPGPPDGKCPAHRHGVGDPGPCGPCGDARRALDAWRRQHPATPVDGTVTALRRRTEAEHAALRAINAEPADPHAADRVRQVKATALHPPRQETP